MAADLESIHPDLTAAVDNEDAVSIEHPLLACWLYRPFKPGLIEGLNAEYERRRTLGQAAKTHRRFQEYLRLIREPYRLAVFAREVAPELKDRQYWKLLAGLWQDLGYANADHEGWSNLFSAKRSGRPLLMNKAERRTLAAMPDVLTDPSRRHDQPRAKLDALRRESAVGGQELPRGRSDENLQRHRAQGLGVRLPPWKLGGGNRGGPAIRYGANTPSLI